MHSVLSSILLTFPITFAFTHTPNVKSHDILLRKLRSPPLCGSFGCADGSRSTYENQFGPPVPQNYPPFFGPEGLGCEENQPPSGRGIGNTFNQQSNGDGPDIVPGSKGGNNLASASASATADSNAGGATATANAFAKSEPKKICLYCVIHDHQSK